MNILLLGNADSVFIKEYVEDTLITSFDTIIIVSNSNCMYQDFYKQNNCIVISHKNSIWYKIPKIRTVFFNIITRRDLKRYCYDIIQICYVTPEQINFVKGLVNKNRPVVLSFFGSDLLRTSSDRINKMKHFAIKERVKALTVSSENMKKVLVEAFGEETSEKIHVIKFALPRLELIDFFYNEKDSIKRENGFRSDDVIVGIGYNCNPNQQHIKVIRTLCRLPVVIKNKICLALQLTYGNSDINYLLEMEKELKKTGIKYKLFTDYMDAEQNAKYRVLCDIIIHAQVSDAFSASIAEHIYAKGILINAKWLKYDEYDNENVFYKSFSQFDDINDILIDMLEKGIDQTKLENNRNIISKMLSSEECSKKWLNVIYGANNYVK